MRDDDWFADSPPGAPRGDTSQRDWANWPCCLDCGRRRLTVCPVCGLASDRFLLAEFLAPVAPVLRSRGGVPGAPSQEGQAVAILLMCPQCDEAFAPHFYRYCPTCGHDAGTGIDVRPRVVEPWPDRVWWVIMGLVAVMAALALYVRALFPPPR